MANVTIAPQQTRQMHSVSVVIDGGIEFKRATQSFQFVPQTTTSSVQGGTPEDVFTDTTVTGWQLQWKFLQDSTSNGIDPAVGALTDYLYDHAGEGHHVDFYPYKGGTGWGADIILPAPPIGGDLNAWLADTVTCGVQGKPTRMPALA